MTDKIGGHTLTALDEERGYAVVLGAIQGEVEIENADAPDCAAGGELGDFVLCTDDVVALRISVGGVITGLDVDAFNAYFDNPASDDAAFREEVHAAGLVIAKKLLNNGGRDVELLLDHDAVNGLPKGKIIEITARLIDLEDV